MIEVQRNIRTFKKLYGDDTKVKKEKDDEIEVGGVAGMVKTIEPSRVTEMLKDNKELIQKLKNAQEDYQHKQTNIKKRGKNNLDQLDLDTSLELLSKPMANNRLNTPNM